MIARSSGEAYQDSADQDQAVGRGLGSTTLD